MMLWTDMFYVLSVIHTKPLCYNSWLTIQLRCPLWLTHINLGAAESRNNCLPLNEQFVYIQKVNQVIHV